MENENVEVVGTEVSEEVVAESVASTEEVVVDEAVA